MRPTASSLVSAVRPGSSAVMADAAASASPADVTRIRLAAPDRSSPQACARLSAVVAACGALAVVEGEVGDAGHAEADGRQRFALGRTGRADLEGIARFDADGPRRRLVHQQRGGAGFAGQIRPAHDRPRHGSVAADALHRGPIRRRPRCSRLASAMRSVTTDRTDGSAAMRAADSTAPGISGPPPGTIRGAHADIEAGCDRAGRASRRPGPATAAACRRGARQPPPRRARRGRRVPADARGFARRTRARSSASQAQRIAPQQRPRRSHRRHGSERHGDRQAERGHVRRDAHEDQRRVVAPLEEPVDEDLRRAGEREPEQRPRRWRSARPRGGSAPGCGARAGR